MQDGDIDSRYEHKGNLFSRNFFIAARGAGVILIDRQFQCQDTPSMKQLMDP